MEKDVLEDDVFTAEQLSMDGISSDPFASQILDFGDDDSAFLPETLRSSDVSSSSVNNTAAAVGCGCYDDSSFSTDTFSPFPSMDAAELSAFLDIDEPPSFDDMNQHLSTTPLPSISCLAEQDQRLQFNQLAAGGNLNNGIYSNDSLTQLATMQQQQQVAVIFEEGFLQPPQTLPRFVGLDPPSSCSFMDPSISANSFYAGGGQGSGFLACSEGQGQGFLPGGLMFGPEHGMPLPELDYCRSDAGGSLGLYVPDQLTQAHADHIQVNGDTQQMVSSPATFPAAAAEEEVSALDEPSFKVGRLSALERKEKIDRYIKKKNQRNFTKKIKYACRKTLADSRPRVRGRFAKNDELGEVTRPSSNLHELEEDEVIPKEEDDDILAQISGVNSFKYMNYALESWI